MKTLAATLLLACANADETSLMQHTKRSASNKLSASSGAKSSRQDSSSKLLDTAVTMIKNGVTPDVISFVDATNLDINDEVLVMIQNEHDIDQAYISSLCQDFLNAVEALEVQATAIALHDTNRLAASEAHHTCRADEAYACAKSRRCEEQLREKWRIVKHEETIMREIHDHIHDEWCIHPPHIEPFDEQTTITTGHSYAWLSHPFNWAQTSQYPLLDLPQDVRDFRHVSVGYFHDYRAQKVIVERAWLDYNEKLVECAELEEDWEGMLAPCDTLQIAAREHACEHATSNRQARAAFGQEWDRIVSLFELARVTKSNNEQDRKNEWETLKIVQCLLDHVHSSVTNSIETGAPCPTIDSDPTGVTLAIEDCHIVTRGCDEDSMTAHLCLVWCEPPDIPPLPPVEEPACTPAYIAKEQAQFLTAIQASYTAQLAANADYPADPLMGYETVLSEAGWAGCAPPLVCVDCAGSEIQAPCAEHTGGAQTCHLHEEYLSPGQSNADTFRCLDGSCILQAGRCNGAHNCADGSDESGCNAETNHFVPAYLSTSSTCPDDFHDDVHFRCANSQCIEKVGMCNGIDNCADGSDEAHCFGAVQVTVEATSGRSITVETLQTTTGVFHDRSYHFDSLGHFAGKTFIKYSNDDKMIDGLHVMTKLRTLEPLTVFIVKLDHHGLSWLDMEGYTPSSFPGVSFSGVRDTRHKEWDPTLLTTDHFAASAVYSKTFPAGTISIPGNNGGDGSFLIFVDRPSTEDAFDSRLTAYWESGNCGVHGNDWNWGWCGNQAGNCPLTLSTDLCTSGQAELAAYHGTGEQGSYTRDGCDYFWHAQYRCIPHEPELVGAAEYIGCFVDDNARDLGAMVGTRDDSGTNTFELCRAACGVSTYMSLQHGGECFCSDSFGNGPQYVEVDESECDANVEPCASTSHNCGGEWRQAIYQINHITQWDMIAHHTFGGDFFPSSVRSSFLHNANDPSASTYMSVGQVDEADYLVDGKFHFRLVYSDVVDAHTPCNDGAPLSGEMEAEWTQTSWITEGDVTGFSAISPTDLGTSVGGAGCQFNGLARSSSGSTVFDGSTEHSWWFGSVGSTVAWQGGIPAFKGGDAQSMTLYIMKAGGGGAPVTAAPEPEPQCGALPQLVHAVWDPAHSLAYYCEEGYSFDGSALSHTLMFDIECLANGFYTDVRVCLPIDDCVGHSCGAFGTCVDQHMDYTCECLSGFEMHIEEDTEEEGEKICGNVDDCHGHVCGEAGVCVDLVSDYECECADGWRQVVRHLDDLKTCERVECGDVPHVDNLMHMTSSGVYPWTRSKAVFEETVEYFCKHGYTTNGDLSGERGFTITCQATGVYTEPLQCLPISCPVPEPAGGATPVSSVAVHLGQLVDYSCPHGFGPEIFSRYCLESGDYSPAIACEPRACGEAEQFPRASLTNSQPMYFFGQLAEYSCPEGYSTDPANPLAHDFAMGCFADGWESHSGCAPVTCQVTLDNSHAVPAGLPAVDSVLTIEYDGLNMFFCAPGYTVDGTAAGSIELSASCSPGGVGQLAPCRPVTCDASVLQIAPHAHVQENRDYTLGNSATYTCDPGHAVANTLAETFQVECLRSGFFSAMSTCRNTDDCVGHSCGSNGLCVDGIDDYSCNCESGFEEEMVSGEKMCGNIDDCGPSACGSYGACHDLVNGYACECDLGYELQGAGDAQICEPKTCPMPAWENVFSTETELKFPQTLFVTCTEGHDLGNHADAFQIECSADGVITPATDPFSGSTSTDMPQCRPKVCGQPPQVFAEQQEVRDYIFGESSVSVCQGGNVQIIHECGADGEFHVTSEFNTCRNSCGTPSLPAHAHRSDDGGGVYHPATASYTCNAGYTPLASGLPGHEFSQACRANGVFEALVEGANGCVPVVCQRPSAPGHWQWLNEAVLNTQHAAYLRCEDGFESSQAAADERFQVTCNSNGQASPLPGACQIMSHTISGRIRNAIQPTAGVGSATLAINGQTITANGQGFYSVSLPAGVYSYSLNAHGFITIPSGSLTVTTTGTFDINMSPQLASDSWRIVLSWEEHPRDLDSHLVFLGQENSCPEMYYGRPQASCSGVTATLDVDDTSSFGPETTTLTNTDTWRCAFGCKWVYKVKNYSGYYDYTNGWQHSDAKVMLYNGDHLVREFAVNSDHGYTQGDGVGAPVYWSVLSIDSSGNVEECSNANCD